MRKFPNQNKAKYEKFQNNPHKDYTLEDENESSVLNEFTLT